MKVTIKVYKFMENLFLDEYSALRCSRDWSHKDTIKTVYTSIDQNELNEIEQLKTLHDQLDAFNFLSLDSYETFEEAEEVTRSENNFKIN